jgi:hypothetical protein
MGHLRHVAQRLNFATLLKAKRSLPHSLFSRILQGMEIHLTPETEKKLKDISAQSGRATDDLVEDAMAGYLQELLQTREILNSRYDDLKSGRVKPLDGEEFFESLRRREDDLLKKNLPQ